MNAEAGPEEGAQFSQARGTVGSSPSPYPVSNQQALDYLTSIDFKTIGKAVFGDYLVTVSDAGKEIGELTISVEETIRDDEICYLVHAHSHGIVDSVPCGTSVTSYIGRGLVTIEQTQHEYMKIPGKPLDKKTVIFKQGSEYFINTTITEGQHCQQFEKCAAVSDMLGFISEGSNVLLQRIFATKWDVPTDALFLCLDSQMSFCLSSYSILAKQKQCVGTINIDVCGIERTVLSESGPITAWRTFFLPSGHMSSRITVGSPVVMKLLKLPKDEVKNEEKHPEPEVIDLKWEEDMQLHSFFLERKEELASASSTYVRRHPELNNLMADFLQFLLLRKPQNVCEFAADYFSSFSSRPPRDQNGF